MWHNPHALPPIDALKSSYLCFENFCRVVSGFLDLIRVGLAAAALCA